MVRYKTQGTVQFLVCVTKVPSRWDGALAVPLVCSVSVIGPMPRMSCRSQGCECAACDPEFVVLRRGATRGEEIARERGRGGKVP